MWHQIFALIVKELLAILKDPKSRTVLIGPPLIQLLIFGYAATLDHHAPIAIYNQDRSAASRDLVARFAASPSFKLIATLDNPKQIAQLIHFLRQAVLVLVIDPRFTRDLALNRPALVQLIVDGRNSNTALLALGYANTIVSDFSLAWLASHGEPAPPALLDMRARYNPALLSLWFIVPGIVASLDQLWSRSWSACPWRGNARLEPSINCW